jgi:two-component system sensor histidine kinase UhpB
MRTKTHTVSKSLRRQSSLRAVRAELKRLKQSRDQLRKELRASEARFRAIAEGTVAAIFIIQGRRFRYVNPPMVSMSGFSKRELLSMNFWDCVHPDDRETVRRRGMERQRRGGPPEHYEFRLVTKAGKVRDVEFTDGIIKYGGKRATTGSVFDITERKKAEFELRKARETLRALAARISTVREEQSTEFAQRIHDDIGPILGAIKMDLAVVRGKASTSQGMRRSALLAAIRDLMGLVDRAFATLRSTTTDFRPLALQSGDLVFAIESLVRGFRKHTGIRCALHCQIEFISLDSDRASAVFRIIQEALTNIARHSGAHSVQIRISKHNGQAVVQIHDDGRGLTTEAMSKLTSLGILGMKERALALGGRIDFKGREKKGTTVTLEFPYDDGKRGKPDHSSGHKGA